MKKVFIFTLILFLSLSMAGFATAEDRLEINGGIRFTAFNVNNTNFNSDVKDHTYWINQRLRTYMRIRIMDGVAARWRVDWQEDTWGLNSTEPFGRPADLNSAVQIDRAFLQIEKPMFDFTIGHFFEIWGNGSAYGPQQMGANLRIKTPVILDFSAWKLNENGSTLDYNNMDDKNMYAVKAEYMDYGAYFAMVDDKTDADVSPWVIGLFANPKFNDLSIKSNIDFFGGSEGNLDVMGTQLAVNVEYPFTKMFVAGADFYYALGSDDPNDVQYNVVYARFAGFEWHERGTQNVVDQVDVLGTGDQPFELRNNSGSIGGDVYGIYKITPELSLAAQVVYLTPEEDKVTNLDSLFDINGSLEWYWAKNALVGVYGWYTSPSFDDNTPDDATVGLASMLRVRF